MQAKNVLGGPLEVCGTSPMTGFHRDGYCRVSQTDYGVHAVCAQVGFPQSSVPYLFPSDLLCKILAVFC